MFKKNLIKLLTAISLSLLITAQANAQSTFKTQEQFIGCIIDASQVTKVKLSKKQSQVLLKVEKDQKFAQNLYLDFLNARFIETDIANAQLIQLYANTNMNPPKDTIPMFKLEFLKSLSKDELNALDAAARRHIQGYDNDMTKMVKNIAPNCYRNY